jgi:predicted CoA-substrate-specific enzyme activase
MLEGSIILGVDSGSAAISLVEMTEKGRILKTHYAFHHGEITKTLRSMLSKIDHRSIKGIACTSASSYLLKGIRSYDSRIACMTAAKKMHPGVRTILTVGGEKFSLITFDPEGNYRSLKTNTSCAAGTGSFLDQQARRLNLTGGSAELSERALRNKGKGTPPRIASRCAVFAKTDIVHAQQMGYSLEEICDGLCRGLADNIADTLLSDEEVPDPIVFSGGVSKNRAVVDYLEKRIEKKLLVDKLAYVYDALGACLLYLEDIETGNNNNNNTEPGSTAGNIDGWDSLIINPVDEEEKEFIFAPLSLKLSRYPEFDSRQRYNHVSPHTGAANPVEIDIYKLLSRGETYSIFLGFDIGSTSTKAVLLDTNRQVLAGLYCRTAGRPVKAVQAILEAIDDISRRENVTFTVKGAGTTGAGRTFAGRIMGADIIPDEITAHARAAYELNPDTDTIIEIGGQDAKFTAMRNGMVTFARMNTVCAAGTGTFIEEQAEKLNVPLSEFSKRAEGVRSPLVSDCCTVYMERDINRLLNKNYTIDEVLAACLFAVRENYLVKVASEGNIGHHICFQGATAKNRALAAAFEQKLQKPIFVSKYCHLTGALGVALSLADEIRQQSGFRGVDIHKQEIPIRTETCELCRNHCRICIAAVKNEEVAYGFLCGRDYDTRRFVSKNKSGFDLVKEHQKAFPLDPGLNPGKIPFTVGIPAALHLFDDLPFWKFFFKELSIPVVTGEEFNDAVKQGKKLAGAEFCSPMNALHGHARYLSDKVDCLFLPIYLEDWNSPREMKTGQGKERKRNFCYYTQFSSSLVSVLEQNEKQIPSMLPLVGWRESSHVIKKELHRSLNKVLPGKRSFREISRSYDRAMSFFQEGKKRLVDEYKREEEKEKLKENGDIRVVLVGRPYTVLSPEMNKGIPGIFASHGIKTYFQDMLPVFGDRVKEGKDAEIEAAIGPLLDACHWKFASRILEAAAFAAKTESLYPVLITSFKCAPDSFIIEYFKRILDEKEKPYLILQLDEHDSNVGYETRIEAGIRSFRNHAAHCRSNKTHSVKMDTDNPTGTRVGLKVNPVLEHDLSGKTVLFPYWDTLTGPLVAANLQRAGIDARLLEENDTVIRKSMRMNTGQCIPIDAVTLETIEYIERCRLDPAKTVLWMIRSRTACNIGMYPHYIKSLLEAYGKGMENVGVYPGEITHMEISPLVSIHAYHAYLFGGLIRKLGCRIRPYETVKGETDNAIKIAIEIFKKSFTSDYSYLDAAKEALALFDHIAFVKPPTPRPKVAIFGDIYMRDNDVINQDLIRTVENAGGEVITTPYNEYVKIISSAFFERCKKMRRYPELIKLKPLLAAVELLEKKYLPYFKKYMRKTVSSRKWEFAKILSQFNVRLEHDGESWENLLKIFYLLREHPDISLFVQTNPTFCCPSLITEAMGREIERVTGVPIVTLTYDGTGTPVNDRIIPYLKYPRVSSS